ncbi:putative ribosome biogenesis GTPase RsgA domain protein [Mycobacterium ulcerans str. Harvey]|uniref:Ribosome biogenesis GTPase RsgA domain protein n=1 Tax=Mycobacterium ulcerans str. Harvey TaxID=1299332 RepID=A0ABN0QXV2_MYCUL|nr:putative ribosome biogenesis GTPase RsgA domain protein [Mycobacterium ulcerans str. Harvey]
MRPGDYDESDVKIRSGRGSRPRTKTRPEHADAEAAMVVAVDRGRWGCVLGGDPLRRVTAMRTRELGRTPIVVGDDVDLVGDLSGRPDTLARIVRRGHAERCCVAPPMTPTPPNGSWSPTRISC